MIPVLLTFVCVTSSALFLRALWLVVGGAVDGITIVLTAVLGTAALVSGYWAFRFLG